MPPARPSTSPLVTPRQNLAGQRVAPVSLERISYGAVGQIARMSRLTGPAGGASSGGAALSTGQSSTRLADLSTKIKQFSFAALTAASGIGAAMLATEEHFSPATYHMFQLNLGRLAATVGSILHPAFESLSDTTYNVAKWLNNLSPGMRSFIGSIVSLAAWPVLLTVGLGGVTVAIRGLWRMAVHAASGINAAATRMGLTGGGALTTAQLMAQGPNPALMGYGPMPLSGAGWMKAGGIGLGAAGVVGALGGDAGSQVNAGIGGILASPGVGKVVGTLASKVVGTGIGKAIGSAVPAIGVGMIIDDVVGAVTGGKYGGYVNKGIAWAGKKLGLTSDTDNGPVEDAKRVVTTQNSVLEAGQMMRENSLRDTANIPLAQIVQQQQQEQDDRLTGTLTDAAKHLLDGGFVSDLGTLFKEFFSTPAARRIN